jgi:hypothetical protein
MLAQPLELVRMPPAPKRSTHSRLAHPIVPKVRLNEREYLALLGEMFDSLRTTDRASKSVLDKSVCMIKRLSSMRKAFDAISEVMLAQLGAFETQGELASTSEVYFLEWGDAREGCGDIIYLCRSVCERESPFNSWISSRVLSVSQHVLERALLRAGFETAKVELNDELMYAESLARSLFELFKAHKLYGKVYESECTKLINKGWHCSISLGCTKYILGHSEEGSPMILTFCGTRSVKKHTCVAEMIKPKGAFGKSHYRLDLNRLALWKPKDQIA